MNSLLLSLKILILISSVNSIKRPTSSCINYDFESILSRIVGGTEISIDKCPYQLSLLIKNKHKCGAVVINKSWALTTADCVKGNQIKDVSLRAGSSSHSSGGKIHAALKIINHSDFNSASKDYNIALIQVASQFDAKTTKPIILASDGSIVKPGSVAAVTGWGVLTLGGTVFPEKLHKIMVPVIDQEVCKAANGKQITDRMFCAGYTSGGKDICEGDFGGPLVFQEKLIGIASWSKNCGKPGNFGVYTSISNLRNWIQQASGV